MKNFSGLTITGATPDGYSVKANGYVEGSWLQSSVMQNYGSNTGKVCVFDNSGWIYYRTPAEIVAEAGGGGSTEVVQTTGTSTTSVMSQKATTDELAKKANLSGGNTFKGGQEITRDDMGTLLNVTNALGDSFFQINQNAGNPDGGIFIGMDTAQTPISFDGDFGLEGQALLSRGSGHTPTWGDITKHGYTELTNEDLNTITEEGWYRAAANNSCTNKPSVIFDYGFTLVVEKGIDAHITQTISYLANSGDSYYKTYSRKSITNGSTWTVWLLLQAMSDTYPQTFSGRKTFSSGINLTNSLQVNGSSGTAGQVLTSTGTGTPKWTTPSSGGNSVASVVDLTDSLIGGNAYFVFNNGEVGSFTGIIYCEYNTSAGDFEFQINDQIFSCTPTSQDITLRVTIDRMYNGYVYYYYYTIISNDALIDNSGFFTDTNSNMYISTNMGSSYVQHGVGAIIKKVL